MNYHTIYMSLCRRGQSDRTVQEYTERHHIVPKHVGGTDDSSNLTTLTFKEHLLAHKLLYKMHGRWQDRLATNAMSGKCLNAKREAQSINGQLQVAMRRGIHSPEWASLNFLHGMNLAEWNRLNPEGQQRGLDKCHERPTQLRMARSKASYWYVAPDGVVWKSRVEAAEHYNVKPFSIENWGRRQHYGWSRIPV